MSAQTAIGERTQAIKDCRHYEQQAYAGNRTGEAEAWRKAAALLEADAQRPAPVKGVHFTDAELLKINYQQATKIQELEQKLQQRPAFTDERAVFEAWCPHDEKTRSRDMAIAWDAWQASAEVKAQRPAMTPLTEIDELAKAYASSYASPHHITFTVEGLRNLIEAAHNLREQS